jgi:hypothetical protein
MGFLRVQLGSHVIKNMNEFLKFLKKVDQCSTFQGFYFIIFYLFIFFQFGAIEKKLYYRDCFFDL